MPSARPRRGAFDSDFRDYLLDRSGVIFKVIGDVHRNSHWRGYVKYYPHQRGDRALFGRVYRQDSVVS
ncbi:putative nucleotidyltransferase [Streptomyces sp. V4I23]|uniref:hypothetical protein n=1 Tax=Streptomyces sp. V4I23 TaxID=3042282 RepID=UPI0027803CD3|nr:hypothetical protein [Streptomyces sp. V4I23]MDQ1006844.1 putative nucleotidyltransferase [Streptomyces sp. V4I23]